MASNNQAIWNQSFANLANMKSINEDRRDLKDWFRSLFQTLHTEIKIWKQRNPQKAVPNGIQTSFKRIYRLTHEYREWADSKATEINRDPLKYANFIKIDYDYAEEVYEQLEEISLYFIHQNSDPQQCQLKTKLMHKMEIQQMFED